jgi:hypothetical protein
MLSAQRVCRCKRQERLKGIKLPFELRLINGMNPPFPEVTVLIQNGPPRGSLRVAYQEAQEMCTGCACVENINSGDPPVMGIRMILPGSDGSPDFGLTRLMTQFPSGFTRVSRSFAVPARITFGVSSVRDCL